jgi:predicted TIM-barrel fold metal-dependent hydrolase
MIIDCDRHAAVEKHSELFPYMTESWRRHFERDEWLSAVVLATNHVRVTDSFRHSEPPPFAPGRDPDLASLVVANQGLTVNGWADHVAARIYLEALNSYGREHWSGPTSKLAILVSPYDPAWSAGEIRRRAGSGDFGAVALPLMPEMLGSRVWDPVYDACVETGLPLVVHFSGVEGRYLGAPPLSGGVHLSAFSRLALMPHLAESNISSLTFEGAFARHPQLQVLFSGFGFIWLPSLLWRLDREWRTFRSDVPWVTSPPSEQVASNMWFSTAPVAEAADLQTWEAGVPEGLRSHIVFGSHAPYGSDSPADLRRVLGPDWAERISDNGRALLSPTTNATV